MVMLMVVICDDTEIQSLGPLTDFLYTPFPHLWQCLSALHNHQSTHLPVPVVFLPVSVRMMAFLLLFPSTVGESKCSYALSEMAEFYHLEKSWTFV
jgi:hypothetical protein